MRNHLTLLFLSCSPILLGQALEEEEYTTPGPFREYHSNLGRQSIVKTNRQKEFNWVGQSPNQIVPGSIPLGSLREWSKRQSLPRNPVISRVESTQSAPPEPQTRETPPIRKIEGWVGSLPSEVLPGSIPLGTLRLRRYTVVQSPQPASEAGSFSTPSVPKADFPLEVGLMAGIRPYFTSNVLRQNDDEISSGVLETSVGFSVSSQPQELGRYLSLVPRLDFLMQWANYGDSSVRDLLNYRFGMFRAGMDFRFPHEWSLNLGLEYDFLHSQESGNRMFDAVVPSFALQKIFALGDTTFLMINGGARYSLTDKRIPFAAVGVFADDGDNLQTSLGLSLIQTFLDDDQLVLSPTLGFSNTHYLRNLHDGRNDLVFFAGVSGLWQITDFFALQLFLNYSTMSTNSIGDSLLGSSSSFDSLDAGGSINLNFSF